MKKDISEVMNKANVVGLWFSMLLGLGLGMPSAVWADFSDRVYQVEFYVFSQNQTEGREAEYWFNDPIDDLYENSITLEQGASYFESFSIVPSAQLLTPELLDGLVSSRQYRLLYHAAWQQKVQSEEQTMPIRLHGGQLFGNIEYELEGVFKLYLTRYLHLEGEVALKDMAFNDQLGQWGEVARYTMNASSRMRSGKVYYLDHPVLGIAIVIHHVS